MFGKAGAGIRVGRCVLSPYIQVSVDRYITSTTVASITIFPFRRIKPAIAMLAMLAMLFPSLLMDNSYKIGCNTLMLLTPPSPHSDAPIQRHRAAMMVTKRNQKYTIIAPIYLHNHSILTSRLFIVQLPQAWQ